MRPKLSQTEKALTAAFRKWMESPTNPYALRSLVEQMVERELQVRLKKLTERTTDAQSNPTAAP